MKKIKARICILLSITLLKASIISEEIDLFISPSGNDSWEGTIDRPLATIKQGKELAKRLWKEKPTINRINIFLRNGVYSLSSPLIFTPEDSPPPGKSIVYRNYREEKAVLCGGIRLTGFTIDDQGKWRLKIPSERGKVEHLYVNHKRATRARYPDKGALIIKDVKETISNSDKSKSTVYIFFDKDSLSPFLNLTPEEIKSIHMVVHHKWDHTRRYIETIDYTNGCIVIKGNVMKRHNPISKGCIAYFENISSHCNTPGEWVLLPDLTLVYYPLPNQSPESTEVWAATTETLIAFKGNADKDMYVERIHIEGLNLLYTDYRTPPEGFDPQQAAASIGAVIYAEGAKELTLKDITIAYTGGYGIWLSKACKNCKIIHCHLYDLGGGGIKIGTIKVPVSESDKTSDNVVDNNIIHHGGRHFPCAVGIWIGHSSNNSITHNDIGDFFYTGISCGWTWGYGPAFSSGNEISYNHIHHIGQGWLSDMGGIYTLGRSKGTRIHHNYIHHIWAHTYGGWGLYTDEGSTDIIFENNLVHDTKDGSFHQHYGRGNIVRNNIFAFSSKAQIKISRADDVHPPPEGVNVPEIRLTFENNIIIWEEGNPLLIPKNIKMNSASNIWWCVKKTGTNSLNQFITDIQKLGLEKDSIIADPLFYNYSERNFMLQSNSPAFKLGFKPFLPMEAGVYGDNSWIEKAFKEHMPDFSELPKWSLK